MQATHQPTIYDRSSRYRAERHVLAFLATVKGYQSYRLILLISTLPPCVQVDMLPRQHTRESVCPDKHDMRRAQVLFILDLTSLGGWPRTKWGIQASIGGGSQNYRFFFLSSCSADRTKRVSDGPTREGVAIKDQQTPVDQRR
jgi:hypothetical protein